jgi:hypothetical protein
MKSLQLEEIEQTVGHDKTVHLYREIKKRRRIGLGLEVGAAVLFVAIIVLLFAVFGCGTTGDRTTYTTIAATDRAVTLSYDGYVDSVISGQSKTNDLPAISEGFNLFKAAERTAIDAAQGNSGAPPSPEMSRQAGALLQRITNAKGKK